MGAQCFAKTLAGITAMAASTQLIVRLEPAEKKRVAREAKRSGTTLSGYVRAKLFNDDDTSEELTLQQFLADLRPKVRNALNAIDIEMETISLLRKEAAARAAHVAERTRQDLSSGELLAVADRLQLRPVRARRKAR